MTIIPKKAEIIKKIFVKEGDRVKEAQILVQLDDADARLQVERSEARVKEEDRLCVKVINKIIQSSDFPDWK